MTGQAQRPGWQLVLHGTPLLRRMAPGPGGQDDLPLGPVDAALLALLALDGPLPRGRVAGWLWPQATPSAALGNLRQRLHRLQRRCGDSLLLNQSDLLALGPQVQLHGADAAHGADADLLGAHHYHHLPQLQAWLESHRSQWRAQRRAQLAQAVAHHQATGDLAAAITLVQVALATHPLDESLARKLMRLHHAQGDRHALQRAFDQCAGALRRELGVQPSADTQALYRQLLLGHTEAAPARLAGLSAQAQELLHLAAVAGPRLSVALAERALGCPALRLIGPWQELQAGGWFDPHGVADAARLQTLRQALPPPILAYLEAWVVNHAPHQIQAPAAPGAGHASHGAVTPTATPAS